MTLEEFKDNIVNPLRKTIEHHKSPTLGQITSREDLTRQWDRIEGMQMSLTHIENVYAAIPPSHGSDVHVQEILPPQ